MKCLNCGKKFILPKGQKNYLISRWYCSNRCCLFLRDVQELQRMNEGIASGKRSNYYIFRLGITKTIKERNKLYKKLYG